MKIKFDGEFYYLSIDDFKDYVDIGKVVYYKLSVLKNKEILIKFYDKNKKLVRTKK